jgi:hypothetical protein
MPPHPPPPHLHLDQRPSSLPFVAKMQDVNAFLFMAMPPELRCYVYNYLSVLVYKRVFPASDMCYWPVYRMPTALVQLNKIVREELKGFLVQDPLQRMNDQLSPTLVSGPTLLKTQPALSLHFRKTFIRPPHDATRRHDKIEITCSTLANWYNETMSSQQQHGGATNTCKTHARCSAKTLHTCVRPTLRGMENKKTYEVRVRLLINRSGNDDSTRSDGKIISSLLLYKMRFARHPTRRIAGPDHWLTIIYLDSSPNVDIAPVINDLRGVE